MVLIEAEGLSKSYGNLTAAHDITFGVSAGEVVGILGPNGAGKTTILRMIAGILTPSSGKARVAGFDSTSNSFAVKERLGFLSGETALYQRLTPREVLAFFGNLHGMSTDEIASRTQILEAKLLMSDFIDQRCGTLSSGQKQKANLARAFLHDPPALILDEPTSSLDVVTGRFVLDAIAQARESGKAVLFSTHIMGEAEMMCDRVVLLHDGRIMDEGSVGDVCARAGATGLTEAFLKAVDRSEIEEQ